MSYVYVGDEFRPIRVTDDAGIRTPVVEGTRPADSEDYYFTVEQNMNDVIYNDVADVDVSNLKVPLSPRPPLPILKTYATRSTESLNANGVKMKKSPPLHRRFGITSVPPPLPPLPPTPPPTPPPPILKPYATRKTESLNANGVKMKKPPPLPRPLGKPIVPLPPTPPILKPYATRSTESLKANGVKIKKSPMLPRPLGTPIDLSPRPSERESNAPEKDETDGEETDLPDGWKAIPDLMATYYWHKVTGRLQYEKPQLDRINRRSKSSVSELQSELLTNCEQKVLEDNGYDNPENSDSKDLTMGVGIESVDEKKSEDFSGCGNAKFNVAAISSSPSELLNVESLQSSPEKQSSKWKCTDESTKHKKLLLKLIEYDRNPNVKVENVGDVRVIFSDEFCIGKGNNETRVYLGLRKDGFGKAVKRIRRDNCLNDALQEKKVLNEFNAKKSKYVVNYSNIEDEIGSEYVYLILDLCEESLENFVNSSSQPDLQKALPEILKQILKGLADLHSSVQPILHRDLKPSNVLRDSQSEFLIADFGISRILKNDSKTYKSMGNMGTEDWIAPESYCEDKDSVDKGRYKKESDVYNAGMVAYYVATKGEHPFGNKRHRLNNMLNGNLVGLEKIKDETLKDLLSWMLNLKPEDRPSAIQALKHPFLMSDDDKFDFLCKVGNQQPIKTRDTKSSVVKQLNSKYSNWKSFIDTDVYDYLRTDEVKRKMFKYGPSLTEFLRLIRNIGQHWCDLPRPRPQPFYKIGDHKAFFLKKFPNLPVWVHAAVRSNEEFRNNTELKNFFNESKPHQ
ncbi:serine/threonine-protein kinase/endoribonuclease IRE1-like isoform X2 [Xenia sp. Carnegie-2017]|uniref:serine/threonine-protein kinase/endoribonuclease IRE1-like isoform X2 n=1 Tax=Xenia sp. Carnegie-2017 TaxID=2897299 RepID=UPI001F04D0F8|nr:serine/threonine-protein kinase/endoribonuclease IRE1-like isoform X2 [Xenia sp. Carnegie-2017]